MESEMLCGFPWPRLWPTSMQGTSETEDTTLSCCGHGKGIMLVLFQAGERPLVP